MTEKKSFLQQVLNGACERDDIHVFIDEWHDGGTGISLHEFLGMTWEEYGKWLKDDDALDGIIDSHRQKALAPAT